MKFFCYDPNGRGFDIFKTAEEAKAAAEKALDDERAEADEGWNEEVERIYWGEIKGHVVEIERRPAEPGMPFDEIVDYALKSPE